MFKALVAILQATEGLSKINLIHKYILPGYNLGINITRIGVTKRRHLMCLRQTNRQTNWPACILMVPALRAHFHINHNNMNQCFRNEACPKLIMSSMLMNLFQHHASLIVKVM